LSRRFRDGGGKRERLLTGDDADRTTLLAELSGGKRKPWRYVHLATHGFFREASAEGVRNPLLLSGVVLAGANRRAEEGLLTAEEVGGLDLRGCRLAVLSACETGLGGTVGGEGVLGLQRAFHLAGARAVVSSLWQVPDRATQSLMERFYDNLWTKKMGRLEAL